MILKCLATGNLESHVIGKGTFKLDVELNGKIKQIILSNVLYNPHLRSNLLSELKLKVVGEHLGAAMEKYRFIQRNGENYILLKSTMVCIIINPWNMPNK